jgi:hypothetical protein
MTSLERQVLHQDSYSHIYRHFVLGPSVYGHLLWPSGRLVELRLSSGFVLHAPGRLPPCSGRA